MLHYRLGHTFPGTVTVAIIGNACSKASLVENLLLPTASMTSRVPVGTIYSNPESSVWPLNIP